MSQNSTDATDRTVVFLDIDGVLNDAQPVASLPTTQRGWAELLDEERVALLNRIVDQTDAEVVVSSSWRQVHSLDELQELLEMAGFTGTLSDETPVLARARGEQIQAWLADHRGEVSNYVALDDSPHMDPLPSDRVVQTSGTRGGIVESEADEAIRKLSS